MLSLDNLPPLRDPRPLYMQAEDALIRILADSQPGDQLPPEPELAHQLGVSRSTLREALRALRDKGFVARKQGVGTFVQPRPPVIPSGLETLESLDVIASRLGTEVQTAQVLIEERKAAAHPELLDKLALSEDDKVTCVCRVKLAGDRPVAYIEDMVPAAIVSLEELRAGFRGSVLDLLQERGQPPPDHARADIRALLADEALGAKLRLRRGTAVLLLEEVLYSTEGKPIDYSRNYFVPGFFDFHVIRRISHR
jgi:GntR family transcriptional regulator